MEAPQDVLVLNNESVALPQTKFYHVGVLIKESSPKSIEFSRELRAQDAEFEEALSPLLVVHRKAAQTAHVGFHFLSKGMNDRIPRRLTLDLDHLACLSVECAQLLLEHGEH